MPKLIHIATVSLTPRAFLRPFAEHFRAKGWTVDVMASGAASCDDCRSAFSHVFDVAWSRNPLHLGRIRRGIRQVRRVVSEGGYDIVHVHTPVAGFATRYALRNLRSPRGLKVIYTAHGFHFHPGGNPLANAAYYALETIAGPWTDHLVVINQTDYDVAVRRRIVPPDRITLVPGIGVDTDHYSPGAVSPESSQAARAELGLSPGNQLFLMIAEFNPGKRHEDAVRAMALLKNSNIHLAFAGAGPLLSSMQTLARTLGVARQIHFLGFQKDVRRYLGAALATLLPSLREGLPRSLLESLSMGIPVIGTDIRGIRDLVAGSAGYLVRTKDPEAIAQAMRRLADQPIEAKAMGQSGRDRILEQFSLARIIEQHERIYSHLLATRGTHD